MVNSKRGGDIYDPKHSVSYPHRKQTMRHTRRHEEMNVSATSVPHHIETSYISHSNIKNDRETTRFTQSMANMNTSTPSLRQSLRKKWAPFSRSSSSTTVSSTRITETTEAYAPSNGMGPLEEYEATEMTYSEKTQLLEKSLGRATALVKDTLGDEHKWKKLEALNSEAMELYEIDEKTPNGSHTLLVKTRVRAHLDEFMAIMTSKDANDLRLTNVALHETRMTSKTKILMAFEEEHIRNSQDNEGNLEKLMLKAVDFQLDRQHNMNFVVSEFSTIISVLNRRVHQKSTNMRKHEFTTSTCSDDSRVGIISMHALEEDLFPQFQTNKGNGLSLIPQYSGIVAYPIDTYDAKGNKSTHSNSIPTLEVLVKFNCVTRDGRKITNGDMRIMETFVRAYRHLTRAMLAARLVDSPFTRLQDLKGWSPSQTKTLRKRCVLCESGMSTMRWKSPCQLCGRLICGSCATTKQLPIAQQGLVAFRICMVCEEDCYEKVVATPARLAYEKRMAKMSRKRYGRAMSHAPHPHNASSIYSNIGFTPIRRWHSALTTREIEKNPIDEDPRTSYSSDILILELPEVSSYADEDDVWQPFEQQPVQPKQNNTPLWQTAPIRSKPPPQNQFNMPQRLSLELPDTLREVVKYAAAVMGCDVATISIPTDSTELVLVSHGCGALDAFESGWELSRAQSLMGHIMAHQKRRGEIVMVTDTSILPTYSAKGAQLQMVAGSVIYKDMRVSELDAPIYASIGALLVGSTTSVNTQLTSKQRRDFQRLVERAEQLMTHIQPRVTQPVRSSAGVRESNNSLADIQNRLANLLAASYETSLKLDEQSLRLRTLSVASSQVSSQLWRDSRSTGFSDTSSGRKRRTTISKVLY